METQYSNKKVEQIKKRYAIFEWLHVSLEPGQVKIIDKLCKADTKQYFIEQVKVFIQKDLGRFDDFYIEFSGDYEKVTKIKYFD